MLTARKRRLSAPLVSVVAGSLLLCTSLTQAWGAPPPTIEQMLSLKPRQSGVAYTIPEADKINSCKVEKVTGAKKGAGWALKDPEGKTLRLFFDGTDRGKVDTWSYYKDGDEVYREMDTTLTGGADQFRWLNAGGTKWGIDETKNGRIKYWKVISAEEVSQEILQALITQDFARLQALMITDAEAKALELPGSEMARIQAGQKEAPARFSEAIRKLPGLSAKAAWQYLQTDVPQCLPMEQTGPRMDVIRHARGTIVFTHEKGEVGMIQTGELIQVGPAWRIVSAPIPGAEAPNKETATPDPVPSNPKLEKLIKELTDHDKQMPPSEGNQSTVFVQHFLKRADIVERIINAAEEKERDTFYRQLADSLSSAAQSGKVPAESQGLKRLVALESQVVKALPGSQLAAYITWHEMQAEYTLKLAEGKTPYEKVQQEWLDRLTTFVQTYPKGEDTPEAILRAADACESPLNKEVDAKNWYLQLKKNYADKPQAVKAIGALRRLESDGQPFMLAGPMLNDPNVLFDVEKLRGKVVLVYYWTAWNTQSLGDFAKLNVLLQAQKNQVELVAVNLDNTAAEAKEFLAKSPAPGIHLFLDGGPDHRGLDSKLATDYGIITPPQLILVGKDGKVVSHTVQVNGLEEELRKLVK